MKEKEQECFRVLINKRVVKVVNQNELVDYDEMYEESMRCGKGFDIKDKKPMKNNTKKDGDKKIKKKEFSEYGIYSRKYGTDIGDENAFHDKYRCECGNLMGMDNENEICEICGTTVTFRGVDIKKLGWFKLEKEDCFMIHPQIYHYLYKTFIGGNSKQNNKLEAILKVSKTPDTNGNYYIRSWEEVEEKMAEYDPNPFEYIGLKQFIEKYDVILDYFLEQGSNRAKKWKFYKFLKEHKDITFINKYPCFHIALRPFFMGSEGAKRDKLNRYYSAIGTKVYDLNNNERLESDEHEKLKYMYSLQKNLYDSWLHITKSLSGKKADNRQRLMGGKMNNYARMVIRPNNNLRIDEVIIPYTAGVILYENFILNILNKKFGFSAVEAGEKVDRALRRFDKTIYNILLMLVKEMKSSLGKGMYCGINRNPTIAHGSFDICKVVGVGKNIHDLSLQISPRLTVPIKGDFDGDVCDYSTMLNDDVLKSFYNAFNPRTNMIISRITGKVDPSFGIIKDQIVMMYSFTDRSI